MAKRKSRAKKTEEATEEPPMAVAPEPTPEPEPEVVIAPPAVTTMEHRPMEPLTTICRKCGSSHRGDYFNVRSMIVGPERITWRRTICLDCCQCRDDVEREAVKQ